MHGYALSGAISAIAFWTFVAIAVIVSNGVPFLKDREIQRTIRALVQQGQPVDSSVIEALVRKSKPTPKEQLSNLLLVGMIMVAAALGLVGMGFAVSANAHRVIYPIFGAAGMVLLIGGAILLYARQGLAQLKRDEAGGR